MCIIIAKEKWGKLPTMETLKTCFNHNGDGAGIMYVDKGQVVIEKGFMDYEDLEKHLKVLYKKFDNFKNKSFVIHCRIGTSGTNTKENTHPYCISDNYKDLHKTRVLCDLGMVHNGIINDYTPTDNVNNTNDTQEFIMKYIYPLHKYYKDFYKNEYILKGLEDITNSKLCFLDTNDDLYFVGDFVLDNGTKYSNTTYKSYTYTYYYDEDAEYWNNYWNNKTKQYLQEGYTYLDDEKREVLKLKDYARILKKLQPEWYISNEYGWEQVGDHDYYININTYDLYEKLENGEFLKIGENTYVYDEHYYEVY